MEFRLHPLVLLNISDHHTRSVPCSPRSSLALPLARPCRHATLTALPRSFKAQLAGLDTPRVLGLLLGTHTARTVEISNSFEIKYDGFLNDVPQLDHAFLVQKQEQCAQLMGVLMRHRPLTLSTHRQEGLPKAGRRWLVLHRQRSAGRGPGAAASGAWALVHAPQALTPFAPLVRAVDGGHGEPRVRALQPGSARRQGAAHHAVRERCAAC